MNRKVYAIINMRTDRNVQKPCLMTGEARPSEKDYNNSVLHNAAAGDYRFVTEAERTLLNDSGKYVTVRGDAAIFPRRALARRALVKIKGTDWARRQGVDNIRIVEIGEFQRDVRPVKHWNIVRKHRLKGRMPNGKARAWNTDNYAYNTGFSLRSKARKEAKILTESFNRNASMQHQYKFIAVPVYAD